MPKVKSKLMEAYVEPHIKDAMLTMVSFTVDDNLSDHVRAASRRYIEDTIAELELRVASAAQLGEHDAEAERQLMKLRAAYQLDDRSRNYEGKGMGA